MGRLHCERCSKEVHPGRGDYYLVRIDAVADPQPPIITQDDLNQGIGAEIERLIRQMKSMSEQQLEHFEGDQRPYNVAVLPAEEGQTWVYLVPAPTKPNMWPLGGDVRYLISADGVKIMSKRQLHKSVIEVEPPKDKDNQQVAGMHTHVLDDIPEDTDVFHVLTRKPSVPEMVITKQFVFQVDPDGSIKYVGKPEEVLKKK
jgi:hypothetical protein